MRGPLLTREIDAALRRGESEVSLDLGRSTATVAADSAGWTWQGRRYPFLDKPKDRTLYYWDGEAFQPAQRYAGALIKLVPTKWGTPTFEIDGIKMLVSESVSPWEDARRKVALVEPRGKAVLDTCGGMGYFAAHCIEAGAREIRSFEKNPDVLWLRALNPWSPPDNPPLSLTLGRVEEEIQRIPDASFDAALHDPPRFGIAGELYSLAFYEQLARVLRKRAILFHYTGAPNKVSRGRDLPGEVVQRLKKAGFAAVPRGDGVLARR